MVFRGRKLVAVALAGPLVVGTLAAAVALPVSPVSPVLAGASTSSGSPDATTLYREAIDTTHSWSVHYASDSAQSNPSQSNSAQSKETLLESGDAGPASGSQTVTMGTGSISIIVIGGITYVKGNAGGLETLVGLSASQAGQTANKWIEFSTDNAAFAQVVAGVRSSDIAQELRVEGSALTRASAHAWAARRSTGSRGHRSSGTRRTMWSSMSGRTVRTCPSKRTR